MFEDSTFESNGRIRTRNRGWLLASVTLNGSVLLALVLIPLFFPQALPRQMMAYLMDAPAPEPAPQPKPAARPENATVIQTEMDGAHIFAPSRILPQISTVDRPEVLPSIGAADWGGSFAGPSNRDNPFGNARPTVRPEPKGAVHVPSTIVAGLLVVKILPIYPPIARAARVQGTVVLEAMISQAGTIEKLRVASGPVMLQQAAVDAVKAWRYRPYLLNGEPVEVETAVNVVFTLN